MPCQVTFVRTTNFSAAVSWQFRLSVALPIIAGGWIDRYQATRQCCLLMV